MAQFTGSFQAYRVLHLFTYLTPIRHISEYHTVKTGISENYARTSGISLFIVFNGTREKTESEE